MARSFQQWKAWCAAKLVEMTKNASDDKVRRDAEMLLTKLQYLRLESLPSFLVTLHAVAADDPQFLNLAPTPEEVEQWFTQETKKEGGERERGDGQL